MQICVSQQTRNVGKMKNRGKRPLVHIMSILNSTLWQ